MARFHETTGEAKDALSEAARIGFANCAFEELEEDGADVVKQFYPEAGASTGDPVGATPAATDHTSTALDDLRSRLEAKVATLDRTHAAARCDPLC